MMVRSTFNPLVNKSVRATIHKIWLNHYTTKFTFDDICYSVEGSSLNPGTVRMEIKKSLKCGDLYDAGFKRRTYYTDENGIEISGVLQTVYGITNPDYSRWNNPAKGLTTAYGKDRDYSGYKIGNIHWKEGDLILPGERHDGSKKSMRYSGDVEDLIRLRDELNVMIQLKGQEPFDPVIRVTESTRIHQRPDFYLVQGRNLPEWYYALEEARTPEESIPF